MKRIVFVIEVPEGEKPPTLEEVEALWIREVLHACGGNKERAAISLDVWRSTLYRMLDRHGLREPKP
jgi:DNA-binding NtrC family response regulator